MNLIETPVEVAPTRTELSCIRKGSFVQLKTTDGNTLWVCVRQVDHRRGAAVYMGVIEWAVGGLQRGDHVHFCKTHVHEVI
mgnify:CR=1 FL=1